MLGTVIIALILLLVPICCFGEEMESTNITRYQVKKKFFALGTGFEVKNEKDQDVYNVKSKHFTFGNKLVLEDMNENTLLKIHQELWVWMPTYKILSAINDTEIATIKRQFTFFKPKFSITSIYGQYELHAYDIWGHSYQLKKNERIVASIDKKYFSLKNTYDIEIVRDENHQFIITVVIVLDKIMDANKNKNICKFICVPFKDIEINPEWAFNVAYTGKKTQQTVLEVQTWKGPHAVDPINVLALIFVGLQKEAERVAGKQMKRVFVKKTRPVGKEESNAIKEAIKIARLECAGIETMPNISVE